MNRANTRAFQRLVTLAKKLLGPDGCPHDRTLTLRNWADFIDGDLRELRDAIAANDTDNICEELGDVMWCLVHIGILAEDAGLFALDAALNGVVDKMIRRHPHVFEDAVANTPEEACALYDKAKAEEQKDAAAVAQDSPHCFLCSGGYDVQAVNMRLSGKVTPVRYKANSTQYEANTTHLCRYCRVMKRGLWRHPAAWRSLP